MAFPKRLLTTGESMILDLRPHWITLVGAIFTSIVILAVAGGASYGLARTSLGDKATTWYVVEGIAVFAWIVLALPRIAHWLTTQFALTNERLISRSGVLSKRSKEIPLEAINDVTFTQSFIDRIVGAGNLVVESAGERGQETFARVGKPEDVQKAIYAASERRKGLGTGSAPPASVADELAKLAALRDKGELSSDEYEAQKQRLLGT